MFSFKVSKDGWCSIQEAMEAGCWVGMQCPTKSSVLSQGCKVQNTIKELGKECLLANQCEHNQLAHGASA